MLHKKIPQDAFPVYLSADGANTVLAALDTIIEAATDPENFILKEAQKLKAKILKHGRTFQSNSERSVSIFFFPSEIIPLLKILIITLSVKMTDITDYYPVIGRKNADPDERTD